MTSYRQDFSTNLDSPRALSQSQPEAVVVASKSNRLFTLPSMISHLDDNHSSVISRMDQFSRSSSNQATAEEYNHDQFLNPLQMQQFSSTSQPDQVGNINLTLGHIPLFAHLSPREHQNLLNMMQTSSPRAANTPGPNTSTMGEPNSFDSILQEYSQSQFNESQLRNSLCAPYQQSDMNGVQTSSKFTSPARQTVASALWSKSSQFNPNENSFVSKNMIPSVSNPRMMFIAPNDLVRESFTEIQKTQVLDGNVDSIAGRMSTGDTLNLNELTAGSEMVCSDIQGHTNGCMFVAFSQMRPCKVTEEDLIGKNKSLKVGMPGICCKNCGGSPGCGRFFPSTFNSFVNGTNPDRVLAHVGHICIHTPSHIRIAIHELERQENVKATCLRYGSRKSFFWYIWSKFQGVEKSSFENNCDESETLGNNKRIAFNGTPIVGKRKASAGSPSVHASSQIDDGEKESLNSHKTKLLRPC